MSRLKQFAKTIAPPFLWNAFGRTWRALRKPQYEWEYVPEGWKAEGINPNNKGWDNDSIIQVYRKKWPEFLKSLEAPKPLGVNHESLEVNSGSIKDHNIMMTFGYVLAKAAVQKTKISFLDWGGGIGHYYMIAKKLMPELEINYTSKDIPLMCRHGKEFAPEATFDPTDACLEQKYDLVLSSASLYYSPDWQVTFKNLAKAAQGYLFVTRLPMVKKINSFVAVQRVYHYGYDTEYLGWCINEGELLAVAESAGLELVRKFITGERVTIHRAPEQCQMLGYLFRPRQK